MQNNPLIETRNQLKKIKNAVILAHYYQYGEIQEIADFVGDSLDLSRRSSQTDAGIIVYAGVLFMAGEAPVIQGADFSAHEDSIKEAADSCSVEIIKYEK